MAKETPLQKRNRKHGKEDFPQSRILKSADGTVVHLWGNKLHNWDGPARIPEGNMKKREYFLYGLQYSEEDWKDRKRSLKGVPWYKDPRFNARN